jgi:hypothetical protein
MTPKSAKSPRFAKPGRNGRRNGAIALALRVEKLRSISFERATISRHVFDDYRLA